LFKRQEAQGRKKKSCGHTVKEPLGKKTKNGRHRSQERRVVTKKGGRQGGGKSSLKKPKKQKKNNNGKEFGLARAALTIVRLGIEKVKTQGPKLGGGGKVRPGPKTWGDVLPIQSRLKKIHTPEVENQGGRNRAGKILTFNTWRN